MRSVALRGLATTLVAAATDIERPAGERLTRAAEVVERVAGHTA